MNMAHMYALAPCTPSIVHGVHVRPAYVSPATGMYALHVRCAHPVYVRPPCTPATCTPSMYALYARPGAAWCSSSKRGATTFFLDPANSYPDAAVPPASAAVDSGPPPDDDPAAGADEFDLRSASVPRRPRELVKKVAKRLPPSIIWKWVIFGYRA